MAERSVTIKILGDASKARGAFDQAGQGAQTFEGKIDGASGKMAAFGGALGGVVAGGALQSLGGFLKDAAQGAADDAASTAQLEQAVKNAGGAFEPYAGQIDDLISKGQDLAFSDDATRAALTALISETGSAEEGMARLSAAQDLARGTGMDLETAAKLLGKVSDENTAVLKRYGIAVEEGADAQDVMNEVDKRFGGQAATFAETDAAKFAIMTDKVGELQEQLGAYLIPIMGLLVGIIAGVIDGISQIVSAMQPWIDIISALVSEYIGPLTAGLIGIGTAITAAFIPALIGWAASMIPVVAQHIALAAAAAVAYAPIIAAILIVGAVVAGLYLAWESNFLGIQDITKQVIAFISPYVQTAIEGLKVVVETILTGLKVIWDGIWRGMQFVIEEVFPIIQTVVGTYIGLVRDAITPVIDFIRAHWDEVWAAIRLTVETVWGIIEPVVRTGIGLVRDAITPVVDGIRAHWDEVWGAIQTTVETVWGVIKGTVETQVNAVQTVITPVVDAIRTHWDTVWGAIQTTVDTIWNGAAGIVMTVDLAINKVRGYIEEVTGRITGTWDTFWGGLSSTVSGVVGEIKGFVNDIIAAINGLITGWNNMQFDFEGVDVPLGPDIPGFSIGTPDIPLIPSLAAGGIVRATPGGRLVRVGEGGQDEAVIPLGHGGGGGAINLYLTPESQTPIASWIMGDVARRVPRPLTG